MSPIVKGILMGCIVAFVVWCVREAVVQYRWERKMQRMDNILWRNTRMRWIRVRGILPLFHEQRRKR